MDNALNTLLLRAREKTESGRLDWVDFGPESFQSVIGNGNLHIQRSFVEREKDGEPWAVESYAAQVSDSKGRVIAEVESREEADNASFNLLQGLFRAARNSAFNGTRVIEGMLNVLQHQ